MFPSSLIHFCGRKFLFSEYCALFRVANRETTQQAYESSSPASLSYTQCPAVNCCVNEVLSSDFSCLKERQLESRFKKPVAKEKF